MHAESKYLDAALNTKGPHCLFGVALLKFFRCYSQSRALAGVKQEIVALTEIPHVGPASARLLFNGGLRNAETIARLPNTDTLVAILSRGVFPLLWRYMHASF